MFAHHLPLLRCPKSGSELELIVDVSENGQVKTGQLNAKVGEGRYPIINFIPRFVELSNYADSFSLEWKTHARTQYDSVSGFPLSETRFFQETGWPRKMSEDIILEVGSGSGRFTEWALSTGATVVSLDYSQAVEANFASNGNNQRLLLVQASIYEMPFEKEFADRAFCFGMIQHTPDPKKAFMAVPPFIKPGGYFASDVYRKSLRTMIGTRYLFRLFTSRMEPYRLQRFVTWYVDALWPLVRLLQKIPFGLGVIFTRKVLNIADHSTIGLRGANEITIKTWAYLNTFDRNSARYEFPQTLSTYHAWHVEAGFEQIDVKPGYNGIDARARKPVRGATQPRQAA